MSENKVVVRGGKPLLGNPRRKTFNRQVLSRKVEERLEYGTRYKWNRRATEKRGYLNTFTHMSSGAMNVKCTSGIRYTDAKSASS